MNKNILIKRTEFEDIWLVYNQLAKELFTFLFSTPSSYLFTKPYAKQTAKRGIEYNLLLN